MDDRKGYQFSFTGFIDYSNCFHKVETIWIIVGACVTIGTAISVVPQLGNFISKRSSFGVNTFAYVVTSIGQYTIVLNYVCLHAADFIGILQYGFTKWMPRYLSFLNVFLLCYLFYPSTILNHIFFDTNPRSVRPRSVFKKDKVLAIGASVFLVCLYIISGVVYTIIGTQSSYFGGVMNVYGLIAGFTSSALVIIQYAPQMWTTCKFKDHGSVSLIMLAIQAPGGMINSLFMALGNNDHWTTWLSLFVGACQQAVLLGICIFFMCKKRKQYNLNNQPLLSEPSKSQSGDPGMV